MGWDGLSVLRTEHGGYLFTWACVVDGVRPRQRGLYFFSFALVLQGYVYIFGVTYTYGGVRDGRGGTIDSRSRISGHWADLWAWHGMMKG